MSSMISKVNNFLEQKLMPAAAKISTQTHVAVIKDGLILSLPLLIVGSIFLVLGFLPIPGYGEFMAGIFGEDWLNKLLYPMGATFDIMALFAAMGISYRLAERRDVDKLSAIAISIAAFMLLTPYRIIIREEVVAGIPIALMGSKGLFVAILVALFATEVFAWFVKRDIVIKMPESVPPAVAKSFAALIPFTVVILSAWVIRIILELTPFEHVHNVIATILTGPLTTLGTTYIGLMIIVLLIHVLWVCGLHGTGLVWGVITPVFQVLADQNRMAFQNGETLPNIMSIPFIEMGMNLGGAGNTIVLAALLTFVAKSKQLKEIGKLSIGPAFFNINEPILFGLPIVMNPLIAIPFILVPLVTTSIAYWATKLAVVPKLAGIAIPWTTPPLLNGFLATGGSFSFVILQAILLLISLAIYYPFFRLYDAQMVVVEDEEKTETIRTA